MPHDVVTLEQPVTLQPFVPAGAVAPTLEALVGRDQYHGGVHRIVGTVKKQATPTNLPLSRRVVLVRARDHLAIRETWSASDGSYMFEGVDGAERYHVIGYDYTGEFRAVIADDITPEPMS